MSYYISPRFLDKLAVHLTKNFLNLPNVRVPLILGVHGRKGEGKSFQCELVFERMGVEVVHMSAGELESPDAGDPARLIRLRYREAAEFVKVRGRMTALMINDLDAGAGRFDATTQYTVNTQLVNGTLMNIADNPTNVQLPGAYDSNPIHRVPIIVTGNDFSTLYAPLIRDGRMEKFYWEPDRDDRVGVVSGIFQADGVPRSDVEQLIDRFPTQSIDFYSALRSRLFDEQVRDLIHSVGIEKISQRVVNSSDKPPEFRSPDFRLAHLIELGSEMVAEQQRIENMRLGREYLGKEYSETRRDDQTKISDTAAKASARNWSASEFSAPNGHTTPTNGTPTERSPIDRSPIQAPTRATSYEGAHSGSRLDTSMIQQMRDLIGGGGRVGIEWVDPRRFRTNAWQSFTTAQNHAEAVAALEACLNEHPQDYVRIVGITADRQRTGESIVQRPEMYPIV